MALKISMKRKEKAQKIREQYIARKNKLRPRHLKWLETLYAVHGDQHRMVRGNHLVDLNGLRENDVDHIRVTHNHLFQSFRAMLASALQGDPTPVVATSRAGRDADQLSRSCERLLRWMYHSKGFREASHSAMSWAFTCGIGFMGVIWDLEADGPTWVPDTDDMGNIVYTTKKEVITDEQGEMVLSPFGTPLTEEVMTPKGRHRLLGDVRFFSPPPFDVFPERVSQWSDVRDIIVRQHVKRDSLVNMFGSKAKDLVADVRSEDFIRFDDYDNPDSPHVKEDLVLVLTRYEKPSLKHPEGVYCVIANDVILHEDALPGGMLPIHPVYDQEHPAHLFGASAIQQALEVQRDLNSAEADLKMDRKLHTHPRLICEQGSLVRGATRVPNVPGAVLEVRPNAKFTPSFLSGPPLPSWVERAPDRMRATIEDITGAHGLSKGDQSGIMSGRQASVVLAADRQKWTPTIKSLATACEHTSSLALGLWKQHGPPEKTIDVYGPIGTPTDVMVFYRDYISDDVRVRIETSTMMPYNEEIRRQQINEAWQIGAIPDVTMYWKLQRHGDMGRILGTDEPSRARAQQENDVLDKGAQVTVEQHEDHAAHVDEHLERMRDPTWYALTEEARQAYRMHVAQHQVFIQNAMNPVLSGASQMPGLPAEGQQLQNLAPTMNGAEGQGSMPGLSLGTEAGMVG